MGARKTRSSMGGRLGAAAVVATVVLACFAPTQIVLRFRTNLQSRAPQTAIQIGSESAFKQGATPEGYIGELVVVPSGERDAVVEVKVALGVDGFDANTCFADPRRPLCVTATRRFRFESHATRSFEVYLSSLCLGVSCPDGSSCNASTGACEAAPVDQTDPTPPAPPRSDAGDDTRDDSGADGATPTPACGADIPTHAPKSLASTLTHLYWVAPSDALTRRSRRSADPPTMFGTGTAVSAATDYAAWIDGLGVGLIGGVAPKRCDLASASAPAAIAARFNGTYVSFGQELRLLGKTDCSNLGSQTAPTLSQIGATASHVYGLSPAGELGFTNAAVTMPWTSLGKPQFEPVLLTATASSAVVVATDASATTTTFYRYDDPALSPVPFVQLSGTPKITGLATDATHVYWIALGSGGAQLYRHVLTPPALVGPPIPFGAVPSYAVAQHLVVDEACIYTWVSTTSVDAPGRIIGIPKP